jgi:predicted DNA-binding protein (MmcQ/YjbR family)
MGDFLINFLDARLHLQIIGKKSKLVGAFHMDKIKWIKIVKCRPATRYLKNCDQDSASK